MRSDLQTWRLDSRSQSLLLASEGGRLPQVIYWGAPLPLDEDLGQLALSHIADFTGGMLDGNPPISLCPQAADTFPGQPGMQARGADLAVLRPDFKELAAEATADSCTFTAKDASNGLTYTAVFQVDPLSDLIIAQSSVTSQTPIALDWLAAPVMPAPAHLGQRLEFSGRWIGEFIENRVDWAPGIAARNNPTGRTGHEHFPAVIMLDHTTSNGSGECYALNYGWPGGHQMLAEQLPDGRRQVQFGHAANSELQAGTHFASAKLYLGYSTKGLNGLAVQMQRHVRERLMPESVRQKPRPVHYNCWEAVYFHHNLSKLKSLADKAAEIGAERFVLDDGWFGRRDDDTSSLGDWWIDERKHPDGLTPLIDHVKSLGMEFGLWVEPEMVNEDSDLYRAHPDWVLGGMDQIRGRQQLVLDMGKAEVVAYLDEKLSAILASNDIAYLKWDHNRVLPHADAAQARGYYALVDSLRSKFPHVEIESCSSGGGRIDFGVLERTHRVWLSDSNDALERTRIQHSSALFLPQIVTGSHVGPRICHTSGRILQMELRAWVAAQRSMGFEMDLAELTDGERATLRRVTAWWKDNRPWLASADILRLDSADPAVTAEMQLAQDGGRFVAFSVQVSSSDQVLPLPLRLQGLDPSARYRVSLVNRDKAHHLSRGEPALKTKDLELSGAYLMNQGLTLPWAFPETVWVVEGERL